MQLPALPDHFDPGVGGILEIFAPALYLAKRDARGEVENQVPAVVSFALCGQDRAAVIGSDQLQVVDGIQDSAGDFEAFTVPPDKPGGLQGFG